MAEKRQAIGEPATANLARSDPSAHNDQMVALMRELVQQVKGLVSTTATQTAELQSIKAELAATKAELKASNETQAKARALDIKRRNQMARAHNANSRNFFSMMPLTNDDGILPNTNKMNGDEITRGWGDAKCDELLEFYNVKPTWHTHNPVQDKRTALLHHLQGFTMN